MIDDPDPSTPRHRSRAGRPAPRPVEAPAAERPPRVRPPEPWTEPVVEPGWGDPFASYATLAEPDDLSGTVPGSVPGSVPVASVGEDREHDRWSGAPGTDLTGDLSDGPSGARQARSRGPLLLALLRPWFEPRPGELRGAIVVLSVALAVSLALWFDATRRPQAPVGSAALASSAALPVTGADAEPAPQRPSDQRAGPAPGRADGSDGWGLAGGTTAAHGPVVHVSGAVLRPGVVTLPDRSRVTDAIDAVGGAMPDARLDRLNLARIVEDGERIHVPRVGEDAPPPDEPASRGLLADGRIDLNAASQAELETLPGVGPARAQAIIAEREVRPFRAPGDLRRVPGIGEATFQRLAPLVAVR